MHFNRFIEYKELSRLVFSYLHFDADVLNVCASSKSSQQSLMKNIGIWVEIARQDPFMCTKKWVDNLSAADSTAISKAKALQVELLRLSGFLILVEKSIDIIFIVKAMDTYFYSYGVLKNILSRLGSLVCHSENLRYKAHQLQAHVRVAQLLSSHDEDNSVSCKSLQSVGLSSLNSLSKPFRSIDVRPNIFANMLADVHVSLLLRSIHGEEDHHVAIDDSDMDASWLERKTLAIKTCAYSFQYPVHAVMFREAGIVRNLLLLVSKIFLKIQNLIKVITMRQITVLTVKYCLNKSKLCLSLIWLLL